MLLKIQERKLLNITKSLNKVHKRHEERIGSNSSYKHEAAKTQQVPDGCFNVDKYFADTFAGLISNTDHKKNN